MFAPGDDGDGGGAGPAHLPHPITPRDEISRSGNPLTPTDTAPDRAVESDQAPNVVAAEWRVEYIDPTFVDRSEENLSE